MGDNTLELKSKDSRKRSLEQVLQHSERALAKNMHADIKNPFGFWDPLGLGEPAPEAHVENIRQMELQHGRLAMTAAFFVSPQKPRLMQTLMLRTMGARDASGIHDISANEKLDGFDAEAAVVRLSPVLVTTTGAAASAATALVPTAVFAAAADAELDDYFATPHPEFAVGLVVHWILWGK